MQERRPDDKSKVGPSSRVRLARGRLGIGVESCPVGTSSGSSCSKASPRRDKSGAGKSRGPASEADVDVVEARAGSNFSRTSTSTSGLLRHTCWRTNSRTHRISESTKRSATSEPFHSNLGIRLLSLASSPAVVHFPRSLISVLPQLVNRCAD